MTNPPEIYPMAMIPMLSVRDVAASMAWYTDKVGFTTVFCLPEPGGGTAIAHLRWAKNADLLLTPDSDPPAAARPKGVGVSLSFLVRDTSVDAMAADLTARGVEIAEGPTDRSWNAGISSSMIPMVFPWSSLSPWTHPRTSKTLWKK